MRLLPIFLAAALTAAAADTLIVADEFPAMQGLAKKLSGPADIVEQKKMPSNLAPYKCVVVYVHGSITPKAEKAFIQYTDGGGRLVLLHHSISSKKRENKEWLPWLGVTLPAEAFEKGGYKYIDPADFELVNTSGQKMEFHESEVYLNQVLSGPRTTLWSIHYKDFDQPTGGWHKLSGKGEVFYFMAGHKASDFDVPMYGQAVVDAVEGRGETGFKPMFDGKTLEGWDGDPRVWKAEGDGRVVGSTEGVKLTFNEFLISKKEYGDFVVRFDVNLRNHNSGMQFRSEPLPEWRVKGLQADMAENAWWGSIYDEMGKRGTIVNGWKGKAEKTVRNKEWNSYEIFAQGDQIRLSVNGMVTAELKDIPEGRRSGVLAMQVHAGPPMLVEFKNVRIKELH